MIGVLSGIICQAVLLTLGEILGLLPTLNGSDWATFAPYIISVLASIAVAFVAYAVYGKRERMRKSNYPRAYIAKIRPAHITGTYTTEAYGVRWESTVGRANAAYGNDYAYVEGPFCPTDDCKLNAFTIPAMLVLEKDIWKCGHCGAEYLRPKDLYRTETESVANDVMAYHNKQKL